MTDKKNQEAQEEDFVQFGEDGEKMFVSDLSAEAQQVFNERKIFVENRDEFIRQVNADIRRMDYAIKGAETALKQIIDNDNEQNVIEVEDESS